MNRIDPGAYLRDVLARIVARHPMSRIDKLLPSSVCRERPSGFRRNDSMTRNPAALIWAQLIGITAPSSRKSTHFVTETS
jgi:hypothetical protein